jgi:DNA (cytosine-5)-methyltransferase 1
MRRIINEVQPKVAFIENSPQLRTRGLSVVLRDLATMGYNARWGVFGVRGFGADHIRERIFIHASNTNLPQREGRQLSCGAYKENKNSGRTNWWQSQSELERVAHGMADRVDRLKAIGNGQVPAVAALAWSSLQV